MLHSTTVNVPLARCEGQGGELVEGLIIIGVISTEYPLRHRTAIFSPADFDVRWEKMIHEADEAVFNS